MLKMIALCEAGRLSAFGGIRPRADSGLRDAG